MKDKTPLYHYPASYAREHGELEQHRASLRSNIACREAIEKAITDNYRNNCLDAGALDDVLKQFGYERIFFVLAATVRYKDWDGRISRDNKSWAQKIAVFPDIDGGGSDRNLRFVVDRVHPGLTDLFLSQARREYENSRIKKPSVRENLNRPQEQKASEPTPKQRKTPER